MKEFLPQRYTIFDICDKLLNPEAFMSSLKSASFLIQNLFIHESNIMQSGLTTDKKVEC